MNAKDFNIFLRNNTGNKSKESLIDGFVVRTKQFNSIISEIKLSQSYKPEQNYLIIGQRGAGKTTLIYRLKYAIEEDPATRDIILPVVFSEEQYNLMDLSNLWEGIIEYFEDEIQFIELLEATHNIDSSIPHYEEIIYDALEKHLLKINKKIIVFIENIDVFFKKIGKSGQQRLREVLMTSTRIRLICSSTYFFDGINDYTDPFYEFFKIIRLEGLTKAESKKLLLKLAEQRNESKQMEQILMEYPTRIESLRRLTAGNPRIISYLFHIFQDNENGKAIVDLYKLLDEITFLYKAELDQLSPQQQKIIDVLARNWDAIPTKDIAQRTNLDSKHISSILKTLERNQVIESINTKTKNNLYRIKDRFLNIWYLMRFGKKKEKESVIWLVKFYDAWCDQTEMSKRINILINELDSEKYDPEAALYMGNVFLSCKNVSPETKLNLYIKTKERLTAKLDSELIKTTLRDSIEQFIRNEDYESAFRVIEEIQSEEEKCYLEGWIYLSMKKYNLAAEKLENIYQMNPDSSIATHIATLYQLNPMNPGKVEKYYNLAIGLGDWEAAQQLGSFYYNQGKIEEAISCFNMAVEHNVNGAIQDLARLHLEQKNLDESERLIRLAIKNNEQGARNNLGLVYQAKGELNKAIKTYNEAIKFDETIALLNLGVIYTESEKYDPEKAIELFKRAINAGELTGYSLLGKLYKKLDRIDEAKEILKIGIENESATAAHSLAHIYDDENNWDEAKNNFLKSIELGRTSSIMCLYESAFEKNLTNKQLELIDIFDSYFEDAKENILFILTYANLLLWSGDYEKSTELLMLIYDQLIEIVSDEKDKIYSSSVIEILIEYFILLISKGQYNLALSLLKEKDGMLKDILKPIYFSLMNLMKDTYPNEYLKVGDEFKETVGEILLRIEEYRNRY